MVTLPRTATRLCVVSLLAVFACRSGGGSESAATQDATPEATPEANAEATPEASPEASGVVTKTKPTLAPLPEVVATVDGHEIPRSEFDARYEPGAAQILARRTDGEIPAPYQAMQREKIIEELVWAKLLELEAERSGVDATPEALAAQEESGRRHIRDWPAWLARVGQTVEIRHQANVVYVRERALFEARGLTLEPTEAELRAAYEAARDKLVAPAELVRASHILITYGPRVGDEKIQPLMPDQRESATPEQLAKWDAAAKARAAALREAALAPGVDFNELAREWSEGPGAFRGGDMGLFPRRQMVGEYAEAAFALEPGQLSEPIKSDKGYYVIKSFGHYPAGPLPFEAVRADLVRELQGQKYKAALAALQAELHGRFTVVSPALDEARAFRAKP
ncbi:Foldase protein PrsA 1 precursor [Enhygromyxa salina]|uniref:peptidylprolyl isomerase n=1 Tax=Enhygromyxa salina TaxID=215803 RepID=A0A2S9XCV9_9BACT|nr:peptidylprolyl isomerase [Enhygromyxa salina]PRP90693.1 Foldase protein PrsA 1 precursor [Enhygromyxa salina]